MTVAVRMCKTTSGDSTSGARAEDPLHLKVTKTRQPGSSSILFFCKTMQKYSHYMNKPRGFNTLHNRSPSISTAHYAMMETPTRPDTPQAKNLGLTHGLQYTLEIYRSSNTESLSPKTKAKTSLSNQIRLNANEFRIYHVSCISRMYTVRSDSRTYGIIRLADRTWRLDAAFLCSNHCIVQIRVSKSPFPLGRDDLPDITVIGMVRIEG